MDRAEFINYHMMFAKEDRLIRQKKIEYLYYSIKGIKKIYSVEVFAMAFRYIKVSQIRKFYNEYKKQYPKRINKIKEKEELYQVNEKYFSKELFLKLLNNIILAPEMHNFVIKELEPLCSHSRLTLPNELLSKKIITIKKLFRLTEIETEFILYLYFKEIDEDISTISIDYGEISGIRRHSSQIGIILRIFARLKGLPYVKVSSQIANLNRMDLLDRNELAEEIFSYLEGLSQNALSKKYFSPFKGKTLKLKEYPFSNVDKDTIIGLLSQKQKGCNILLYGEPGTGKTEFARSVAKQVNLDLYDINHTADKKEKEGFRYRAINACENNVNPNKSLVLIDEADSLLNDNSQFLYSGGAKKELVNTILDKKDRKRIWITNHSSYIDKSIMRRFDYAIEFKPLKKANREKIWITMAKKHKVSPLFKREELKELAEKFDVNSAGIDIALSNVKHLASLNKKPIEIVENLLKSHIKITRIEQRKENNINSSYSLEGLNVSFSPKKTIDILQKFYKYKNKNEYSDIRNMNVLLYGPPGTGKTEFAKYVSQALNKTLMTRKASDLLGKYIGESEKLIRDAFQQAEDEESILFIDEADGLLPSRSMAKRTWEVTLVNEFLTGMENFNGVLICATNFREFMDAASIRRFNIKLKLDYLTSQGVEMFYKRIFKNVSEKKLLNGQLAHLKSMKYLTPGDFKAIYQRTFFLPKEDCTHELFIDALEKESALKNEKTNKMGFIK